MRLAIIKDGPLVPVRDGASYKILNFALEYQRQGAQVSFLLIDRGWCPLPQLQTCGIDDIWLVPPDAAYGDRRITDVLRSLRPDAVITNIPELILEKKEEWREFFVVYDSHDILSQRLLQRGVETQELLLQEFVDLAACEIADMVLCCSDRDAREYAASGIPDGKLRVTFNGCRVPERAAKERDDEVVFLGHMFFEPNQTAFTHVLEIAREMPDVRFTVIGAHPPQFARDLPANVALSGPIDDLSPLLSRAKIGIAPLEVGSGSRVKIVDYLAHGLHVVSTAVGAAGLEPLHGFMSLEDDVARYPSIIRGLLASQRPNDAGRQAVAERYDFRVVVKEALRELQQACVDHAPYCRE